MYLSRKKFKGGSNRYIVDEDRVEKVFEAHAFEIIYPEELSMRDQILAVAEANIVAGADGSALHLSGFMRSGSLVMILQSRSQPAVKAINDALGIETRILRICKVASVGDQHHVTVDLEALEGALDQATKTPLSRNSE